MRNSSVIFAAVFVLAVLCAHRADAQYPYPYNPYMPYYAIPPSAGNLYGASQVIQAQNQQLTSVQQAKLMQQQVKQSKVDTKRAAFDEWKYEQANTPTQAELKAKEQLAQLQRARNEPPITEIWSAQALNVLLQDLQKLQNSNYYSQPVQLDPQILKHINVTASRNDSSIGLLRADGKLEWPYALRSSMFASDREDIDQLMLKVVNEAKGGTPSYDTVSKLEKDVKQMTAKLREKIKDIPSNQWIDAKRYADQLSDTVKLLQESNVSNYFNGKWQAKGSTAAELVAYMTNQGLRFAPVTAGDEAAYAVLYRDLLSYDTALGSQMMQTQMASTGEKPKDDSKSGSSIFNMLRTKQ